MEFDHRLYQALLRTDFRAFAEKVFYTLNPGEKFVWAWYFDSIAWHLERVRRGEIRRLIINLPPRSLKSIMASVAWPAFLLGRDPTMRIICASYSGDLARKFSNDFRTLIDTNWYKSLFPWTRIGDFKDSEVETEFTARGSRLATSVGGTLTGRGGDIIIVDDPLKPDDAELQTIRSNANQWFTNTLLSRLDDKRTGAIVVVMQRVHMDDLTGFLLDRSDEWMVLNLPAIATVDQDIPTWNGAVYHRDLEELLSHEREPRAVLDELKNHLGSAAFSAQYQQEPQPAGGSTIQRAWIKRYAEWPTEICMKLQSWDTANKGGPENDWSVCTTWYLTRNTQWYLIDVWRGRLDYPGLKAKVREQATKWQPNCVLVEEMGTGISLVAELKACVPGIIGVTPNKDKRARMSCASAKFEAGQVFLPEKASWLSDLEDELLSFPGSRYDDQCDSISQALENTNLPMVFTLEMVLAAKRYGRRG